MFLGIWLIGDAEKSFHNYMYHACIHIFKHLHIKALNHILNGIAYHSEPFILPKWVLDEQCQSLLYFILS